MYFSVPRGRMNILGSVGWSILLIVFYSSFDWHWFINATQLFYSSFDWHWFIVTAAEQKSGCRQLNPCDRALLESHFTENIYPNRTTVQQLAFQLAVNEKVVVKWLRNERDKLRIGKRQAPGLKRKLYTCCMCIRIYNISELGFEGC